MLLFQVYNNAVAIEALGCLPSTKLLAGLWSATVLGPKLCIFNTLSLQLGKCEGDDTSLCSVCHTAPP